MEKVGIVSDVDVTNPMEIVMDDLLPKIKICKDEPEDIWQTTDLNPQISSSEIADECHWKAMKKLSNEELVMMKKRKRHESRLLSLHSNHHHNYNFVKLLKKEEKSDHLSGIPFREISKEMEILAKRNYGHPQTSSCAESRHENNKARVSILKEGERDHGSIFQLGRKKNFIGVLEKIDLCMQLI